MKTQRVWVKGISAGVAALLSLTACSSGNGGSGGNKNDPGKSANGETTLRIMWWGADARHQATLKALDVYTKQKPGIKFTPEYLSWDGYWSKLTTLAASKSMTDVLQMDGAYIQDYASKGTLEDLSDIDLKGIVDPKVIDNSRINGKLYGIPLGYNGQGMAFNKPDLEAAGIKLPAKNWTWEDFFAFAQEGRAKLPKGKYPIGDGSNIWDYYQYYQASKGKGPIMVDGKKFNLDKDLWYEFQNKFQQFRKDGTVPPPDMSKSFVENDPKGDPMASGVVMTRGATVASVGVLDALMPGKVEVVNMPVGPSGGGWAQSTIYLSVSSTSKNKKEAKEFIRWFISDKEAGKVLGTTRGIPIYNEIYKEIEPTLKPQDLIGKKLLDAAMDKALPFYPAPTGWSEWVQAYQTEMEAVWFGQKSLDDAYKTIVQLGKDTEAKLAGK